MKISFKGNYRERRAKEYPSIGDQLDVLWKLLEPQALANPEARAMLDRVKAVKQKFPKG